MKTLFVTGTDTGVGKTRVGCALISAFVRRGRRLAVLKPAETGCELTGDGSLRAFDAEALTRATGRSIDPALACPFRYPDPASPATAARLAGRPPPDIATVSAVLARLGAEADLTLLEGAGGLLVPLSDTLLTADLISALRTPILIVATTALGTLNHTLLTLAVARQRQIPVLGLVLNQTQPPAGPEEAHVARLLGLHGQVPLFGTLPYAPGLTDPAELAAWAEAHLDLDRLLRAIDEG